MFWVCWFFVLFFTSGKLVWGVLACSMCADSVCARSVGKCQCPAVVAAAGRDSAGVGLESYLCLSPISELTHATAPLQLSGRGPSFAPLPCAWLLLSLLLPGSRGVQGTGLREGGRLGGAASAPGTRSSPGCACPCPRRAGAGAGAGPFLLGSSSGSRRSPARLGRAARCQSRPSPLPSDHGGGTPQLVHSLDPRLFLHE